MWKDFYKRIDYVVLFIVVALFSIGALALYSASHGAGGNEAEFSKQLMWFGAGIGIMFITFLFNYKHLKNFWLFMYLVFIILLILVLFTNRNNGATSWFKLGSMSFQPSELFKIVMIISLASIIDNFENKKSLNKIWNVVLLCIVVGIPSFLIIKQPDYGTALVILSVFCAMLFYAGIHYKYIITAVICCIIGIPLAYNYVLPEHAKSRIMVFLNPGLDPKGAGYNVIQSELAVGSGKAFGMGLTSGNQTQLGMLPMKTTDFIYSVIGEEMGFFVSSLVVILYLILLIRIINIAYNSKNSFGSLLCVGVFAMILAHFVENVGMTIGLMPITGIPLPFISYGGSSMITNMIAIGMVLSVNARKKKHSL